MVVIKYMDNVTLKGTEATASLRSRRPSTEVDKERALAYLKSAPLADRVELVKALKANIDAEVKSLTEAAASAASLTNGL
jgi:hypothetical protein